MNKSRKAARFFALLLIAAGLLLLMKEPIQNYLIRATVQQNRLNEYTVENLRQNETAEAVFAFDQTVPVDWETVLAGYRQRTELPVIGGIAIPSIQLQLPILKGIANENLIAGAGTMTPLQEIGKGNYALASHNLVQAGILFSDVQEMQIGDLLYVTDLEKIAVYQLTYLEQVSPARTELVEEIPGKTLLTVVTCSDDTLMRWVGQAELVEMVKQEEATAAMTAALQLPQQNE